jgi:hypothetical protein
VGYRCLTKRLDTARHMRRLIPSAEPMMVEQAGHPGFLERSAAYDDAIAGFAVVRCAARTMPVGDRLRSAAAGDA